MKFNNVKFNLLYIEHGFNNVKFKNVKFQFFGFPPDLFLRCLSGFVGVPGVPPICFVFFFYIVFVSGFASFFGVDVSHFL